MRCPVIGRTERGPAPTLTQETPRRELNGTVAAGAMHDDDPAMTNQTPPLVFMQGHGGNGHETGHHCPCGSLRLLQGERGHDREHAAIMEHVSATAGGTAKVQRVRRSSAQTVARQAGKPLTVNLRLKAVTGVSGSRTGRYALRRDAEAKGNVV
jgi:hypothetical protein